MIDALCLMQLLISAFPLELGTLFYNLLFMIDNNDYNCDGEHVVMFLRER